MEPCRMIENIEVQPGESLTSFARGAEMANWPKSNFLQNCWEVLRLDFETLRVLP